MEEKEFKIQRGRPRYYTEEERRKRKTDDMLHKPWFCVICNNDKDYTLAGKHCHLQAKKHYRNALVYNLQNETE